MGLGSPLQIELHSWCRKNIAIPSMPVSVAPYVPLMERMAGSVKV